MAKKEKNEFISGLISAIGDDVAVSMDALPDTLTTMDTGSYSLNALLGADIFKGPPVTIIGLAGDPSTGKTFFAVCLAKLFLDTHPNSVVIYYESEQALFKQMMVARGIDPRRIVLVDVETVQQFRSKIMNAIKKIAEEENPPKVMMILDSLGMLSTTKEVTDMEAGKETKDMTRPGLIRGAFRAFTKKLGKLEIPMIVTNHTYDVIGNMFVTKEMGGGGGLKFAASCIVHLSKAQDAEGTGADKEIKGAIITCKLMKGRFSKEKKKVKVRITFENGLDRYYGLIDLAAKAGLWTKAAKGWNIGLEKPVTEKAILKDPEKYFTLEVLNKINDYVKVEFAYGQPSEDDDETLDDVLSVENNEEE